jgi:hypothetical protein
LGTKNSSTFRNVELPANKKKRYSNSNYYILLLTKTLTDMETESGKNRS